LKRIIFGIGTGRCGTQSLAALLNEQPDVKYVSHEYGRTWTSWRANPIFMYRIISNLLARPGAIVGDVSFYHLPNIETILKLEDRDIKRNVEFKVICLKRDKDLVVRSFMKATKSERGEFNHWTSRKSQHWENGDYDDYGQWDPMYPKYDLPKEDAINKYYDDYYVIASKLQKLFPDKFRIFDTVRVLNYDADQVAMLRFAGFDKFNIKLDIKKNVQFK